MMISKFKKRVGTLILAATMGVAAIMPTMAADYHVTIGKFSLTPSTYVKSSGGKKPVTTGKIFSTVQFNSVSQAGVFYSGFRKLKNNVYEPYTEKKVGILLNNLAVMKEFTLVKNQLFQQYITGGTVYAEVKEVRWLEK